MAQTISTTDPKEELLWRADAAARQAELVPPEERKPWLIMAERCRTMADRIQGEQRPSATH
jgi:hypothetical protein